MTHLTDSTARIQSGALQFLYDDPSSEQVLKPTLMNSFSGAEISTQHQQFTAQCPPIVTANEFLLDELVKVVIKDVL